MAQYLGDVIERKYNDGLKDLGRKLWRGLVQVTESGFGKGMLVTAGVVIGGAALLFGFGAGAGLLKTSVILGNTVLSTSQTTIGSGLGFGLSYATHFLTSFAGLLTLAAGGVVGNAVDAHKEPKKLSVAQAQDLAKEYGIGRQPGMEQQQAQEFAGDDMAQNRWQTAELKRRAARNTNNEFQAV